MRAYGITDVGNMRSMNQDAYKIELFEESRIGFFLVCDGMGGAKGGEIASKMAIDIVSEEIQQSYKNKMLSLGIKSNVENAILKANNAINSKASDNKELFGMGTTLVCAIANQDEIVIANVGDSRAYIVENDKIHQITVDHSLVNDLVVSGKIAPEEALMHPKKNIITRALGVDSEVKTDFFTVPVRKGISVLLCSDGLTNEVSDPEICYEILNGISEEEVCKGLVSIAKKRGGHDNITAVLVTF